MPRKWADIRRDWPGLSAYQRFETTVALLLTVVIGVVIVIALSRLAFTVFEALIIRSLNPLEHEVFRLVFGEILTLLIALEFNHTLQYVITRAKGIVQVRVVIIMSDCPRLEAIS
jgi:phosphate-starvation-inducible protein E